MIRFLKGGDMRASKMVLALTSLFALGATGVAAQAPSLSIVPKIGMEMPMSDLPSTPSAGAVKSLSGAFAWGVAAELGLPGLPFSLRANVDATTKKTVSASSGITNGSVDQTMMTIFGDLVFRPLPRLILVQPYLMGGLGVKRYNYSLSDPTNLFQESFTDRSELAYHLGVGLDVGLGPAALVAEVNDYMNNYQFDSGTKKFQQDVFIMVGLRLGLF
jgi:opacity protein-like surface antigen